jgi:hypothetical protein
MKPSHDATIAIGPTTISIFPTSTLISFADGRTVAGQPEDTAAYRATAFQHGYDEDTLRMWIDHEIIHIALAHWLGLADSPTMKAVRYDRLEDDHSLRQLEEIAVLAVQQYARAAGLDLLRLFTSPAE